ncbi:hypothetical protein OAJ57_05345 [Alphaproteobacteria bacterium]|nr:hypothetical protein [Alphaproteobacteria bacterium]
MLTIGTEILMVASVSLTRCQPVDKIARDINHVALDKIQAAEVRQSEYQCHKDDRDELNIDGNGTLDVSSQGCHERRFRRSH